MFTGVKTKNNSAYQNAILRTKLKMNTPGDQFEQEADAMADRVIRMPSKETVKPVTGLIGKSLQRKCAHCEEEEKRRKPVMRKTEAGNAGMSVSSSFASSLNASKGGGSPLPPGTKSFMENAFSTDFSSVKIHTDSQTAEMSKGINAKAFTFGNEIYFNHDEYNPSTIKGKCLLAHELTHVVQQKGGPMRNRHNSSTALVPPVLSSETHIQRDVIGARDQLMELERQRIAGRVVNEVEQRSGELEALSSSQQALNIAHDAVGSEIANVSMRLLDQISIIESARARGYIRAITELNARGLDNSANYTAFGIAIGGNLLWALSGIVPMIPVAAFTIRGLGPFFNFVCRSRDAWTATIGVVGAMTAQFSSGLPSGTSSSGVKSAMIDQLTTANSTLCNHLRRRFYILLTDAIAHAPLEPSTDSQTYAAELEVGLSHALYGDIYNKHLNDGDLVNASAVERDARNQLLVQYVAGSSAIDTHIVGSNDIGATRSASDANVVDDAISLLGGQGALHFEPYELVFNQARTAAIDLGVTLINFEPASVSGPLSRGTDVFIPATNWNPNAIFSGSPSRWMNPLHTSSIVNCQPGITNEAYMNRLHIRNIQGVSLRSSQMESLNGRIWSMNKLWFSAQGGPDDTSGFIQVTGIPQSFYIMYQIQD